MNISPNLRIPLSVYGKVFVFNCTYRKDVYCASCGNRGLWEGDDGDQYGPPFVCLNCNLVFTMQLDNQFAFVADDN